MSSGLCSLGRRGGGGGGSVLNFSSLRWVAPGLCTARSLGLALSFGTWLFFPSSLCLILFCCTSGHLSHSTSPRAKGWNSFATACPSSCGSGLNYYYALNILLHNRVQGHPLVHCVVCPPKFIYNASANVTGLNPGPHTCLARRQGLYHRARPSVNQFFILHPGGSIFSLL